jgi:effector-binding domain-containing protein
LNFARELQTVSVQLISYLVRFSLPYKTAGKFMRKIVLAGLLISAAVFFAASFFLPRTFVLEKSTDVAAPASYLYEEINDLERWPLWAYWFDENAQVTYGDRRSGTNARCTWKARKRTGEVILTTARLDQIVTAQLTFGNQGSAEYEFRLVPDTLMENRTRLIIKAEVSTEQDNSIWTRWKRFLLANRLASSLTHNTTRLQRIAESKPVFDNVTEEVLAPSYYVSIRSRRRPESTVQQIRTLHAQVMHALNAVGSDAAGHPFCLFGDSAVMEFAVPVDPDARVPDTCVVTQHYSGRAIRGIDSAGYDDISRVHSEVQRYIQYKDYVINGTPWEVYTTDPAEDPSTWATEVYYPIRAKEDENEIL